MIIEFKGMRPDVEKATFIADSATLNALYADDAPRTSNAQPTPTPPTQYAAESTPEPAAATDDPSVGE